MEMQKEFYIGTVFFLRGKPKSFPELILWILHFITVEVQLFYFRFIPSVRTMFLILEV